MSITQSRRTEFAGCHIDPVTKVILWAIAKREGRSMSEWMSDAVEEKLAREVDEKLDFPNASRAVQEHIEHLRTGAL